MSSFYIEAIIVIFLPAIFAGISSAIMWPSLGRPWLFFVILVVLLYAEYMAVINLTPDTAKYFLGSQVNGENEDLAPTFYLLGEYWRQITIFVVLATLSTWGLFHIFRSQA